MEDGDGDEYLAQLAVDKTPRDGDCDADEQLRSQMVTLMETKKTKVMDSKMVKVMDTKMVKVMDTLLNWLMRQGKKAKEVQTGGETASHYHQRTNTASFTIQNVFVQIVKCICPN